MVFGPSLKTIEDMLHRTFNSLWELDGVRTFFSCYGYNNKPPISFNSLWELDGVRTVGRTEPKSKKIKSFNSLWELDGVRTLVEMYMEAMKEEYFQFPVGIRWCSDGELYEPSGFHDLTFQFPVGIRWCSDGIRMTQKQPIICFQFPVGIRWCSDCGAGSP